MRSRLLTTLGSVSASLVIGAWGAWLASGAVAAQAQRPAAARAGAKPWTAPRTPDGQPDLQGVYDVATITPVERPAALGNRLILTDEEVAAMESYEKQRVDKAAEPSKG